MKRLYQKLDLDLLRLKTLHLSDVNFRIPSITHAWYFFVTQFRLCLADSSSIFSVAFLVIFFAMFRYILCTFLLTVTFLLTFLIFCMIYERFVLFSLLSNISAKNVFNIPAPQCLLYSYRLIMRISKPVLIPLRFLRRYVYCGGWQCGMYICETDHRGDENWGITEKISVEIILASTERDWNVLQARNWANLQGS